MRVAFKRRSAMQLLALLAFGGFVASSGYDALHIVDLQQVICDSSGYLDIELDQSQLSVDPYKPHVVSFLRSSNLEAVITFSLVNGAGKEWAQGAQAVTLQALSARRLSPNKDSNRTGGGEFAQGLADAASHASAAAASLAQLSSEAVDRRLASRRLAPSPRRRAPRPPPRRRASSPRRRSSSSPPRRRSGTTPRRRAAPSSPPPRRRADTMPRRRASTSAPAAGTATPPRRRTALPRRRQAPVEVGPRRRTTAYTPPSGGPNRWSTAGTGGSSYGYTNQQGMQSNYGGGYPQSTNYGYGGHSSYGASGSSGKSNAMMYMAGGLAAGAIIGVGSYYMYQRMTQARCDGYDCCYGCNNACYNGNRQDCRMDMNRQYYRDDLMMDAGFYPQDFPGQLKVRIFSVAGDGYPTSAICPDASCTDLANCVNMTTEPQDLFVTLTVLENLAPEGQAADAPRSAAGLSGIVTLSMVLLALRAFHRGVF